MDNETCNDFSCQASTTANPEILAAYETYGPQFDEVDVGWFYYNDEFRVLQPFWKLSWVTLGRGGIESPLSVAFIPLLAYITGVMFFTVCDFCGQNWHWIQKYKLQKNKVTGKVVMKAVKLTMWNNVILIAPIIMMQYVMDEPKIIAFPLAPTLFEFCFQNAASTMSTTWIDDSTSGVILFTMQAWCAQYLHPWELFCIGIYNGSLPAMFNAHWLTMISFSLLNVYVSILGHCGYDLPIDLNNAFPFLGFPYVYGGARKHDMHHMKPYTNFQPFFSTWDRILGDECPGLLAGHTKPADLVEYEKKREKKALSWYKDMPERKVENENSYKHF